MFPAHTAARFKLESHAGGGGMGQVYRATDLATGQIVAIKLLRKKAAASDRQRFLREIEVLADLRHPSIVTYIDHGEWSRGRIYLAMEWLEGEDLGRRVRRKPLGMADAVEVVRRAAQGMAAIHARGVVHRDLKLSNIFIVQRRLARGVKLIDFGVVKLPRPDDVPTLPGTIIGTPHYMSPEQAQGLQVDARADVYSLGAMLFRLVVGRFAFEDEHVVAYLARIVLEDPPRASTFRPDVPEPLDELLANTLSRNRQDRPEDAGALARRLARLPQLSNDPPRSGPPPIWMRSAEPDTTDVTAPFAGLLSAPYERAGTQERRIVAVVLAAQPAPETPVILFDRVLDLLGEDARLEALQGGQLVAAIGITQTRGDEAVRAARAALMMLRLVPDARVSVAIGHAVTGPSGITGEALEHAAVQLARAASGTIRVDQTTCSLLEGRFVFDQDDAGAVLLHEDRTHVGTRSLLGVLTPTVGRDQEIGLLVDAFRDTLRHNSPRAVVVSGPAGIGKSRLRSELLRRLTEENPGLDVLVARGDPVLAGTGLSALGQALRQRMGIRDGEPPPVQARRVLHFMAQRPTAPEETVLFLQELVGVPMHGEVNKQVSAARESPRLMMTRIKHAVETVWRHDAMRSPQVLVLEDLHAIDESTVEMTDWLLGSQLLRVVVFAFGRPEWKKRFPGLWSERKVSRVEIGPLSADALEKIVASVPVPLDEEHRRRIIGRSEGNALFLEELLRNAAEGRDDLPMSVQAVVQLRLDKLPSTQRAAARAASVFGRFCWTGGVCDLLGRDCRADLELLAQAEILEPRPISRIAGQTEWMFANIVEQETAYSSLLPADRPALHRAASRWLVNAGEGDPGILARHIEAAGDREQAAQLYGRAAAKAFANGQLVDALPFAERSLVCSDDPARRARAALQKAQILSWLARYDDGLEAAEIAASCADPGTDPWGEAQRLVANALREKGLPEQADTRLLWTLKHPLAGELSAATRSRLLSERVHPLADLGRSAEARDIAEMAVTIAEQAGEAGTNAMLRALDARVVSTVLNDFSDSIRQARVATEYADAVGDLVLASRTRITLGFVLNRTGLFEEGQSALERALINTRAIRTKVLEGFARHNLGMSRARLGHLDEGIALEQEACRIGAEVDHLKLKLSAVAYEVQFRTWRGAPGDLRIALEMAEKTLATSLVLPVLRAEITSAIAQVHLARRDFEAARIGCEDALRYLSTTQSLEDGEEALRLTYAEALFGLGMRAEADDALREAYECVVRCADRLQEPQHRDAYLSRLFECRAIASLASQRLGTPALSISSAPPPGDSYVGASPSSPARGRLPDDGSFGR